MSFANGFANARRGFECLDGLSKGLGSQVLGDIGLDRGDGPHAVGGDRAGLGAGPVGHCSATKPTETATANPCTSR